MLSLSPELDLLCLEKAGPVAISRYPIAEPGRESKPDDEDAADETTEFNNGAAIDDVEEAALRVALRTVDLLTPLVAFEYVFLVPPLALFVFFAPATFDEGPLLKKWQLPKSLAVCPAETYP